MKLPNPLDLQKLTKEAIARGNEEKEKQLQEEIVKQKKKEEEYRSIAAHVLEQVPTACEKAATKGQNTTEIMELDSDRDYKYRQGNLIASDLKGPALIVYEALMEAQLNPYIEYWHDGMGMKSGFKLKVNWSDNDKQ